MAYKISDIQKEIESGDNQQKLSNNESEDWVVARWEQRPTFLLLFKDVWGVLTGKYHAIDWSK